MARTWGRWRVGVDDGGGVVRESSASSIVDTEGRGVQEGVEGRQGWREVCVDSLLAREAMRQAC